MAQTDSNKMPTLKCPDCGGIFRTLDWWEPGMPCPSCQGRNMAPIVEVVAEEEPEPPKRVNVEELGEKAREAVKETFTRHGWRSSPITAVVAIGVSLFMLYVIVFSDGSIEPTVSTIPCVCDECAHKFEMRTSEVNPVDRIVCPNCQKPAGCVVSLALCPHCGETVELYRTRVPDEVIQEAEQEAKEIGGAVGMGTSERLHRRRQIKAPGGKWLDIDDPAARKLLDGTEHRCPKCANTLGGGLQPVNDW